MKEQTKKASVLIYTLFLINVALLLSLVVFNIAGVVIDDNEYQNVIRKLSNNILYKGNLALKYVEKLNANGSGFVDILSCPSSVTMEGNTQSGVILTELYASENSKFCSGSYLSKSVTLLFNSTYTDFTGATYDGNNVILSSGDAITDFPDTDSTHLSFSLSGLAGVDNIDDNFNSDDYTLFSSGSTPYPNSYQDDDILPRKVSYFYIPPDTGYASIFFNNTKFNDFIGANPNNDDGINKKIGDVDAGYIYLDVDKGFEFKLVQFNKSKFDQYNELIPDLSMTGSSASGAIGFVQDDGTISNLGAVLTGNEYEFNFKDNMYGLFLANSSTGTLLFQLRGYTNTGAQVYVTAVDDSDPVLMKYLGNDIIIDNGGRYIYNQFEIVGLKQ